MAYGSARREETETETGLFSLGLDRARTAVVAMLGIDAIFWVMMYGGHVPMPGMKWLMMERSIPMAAPGAMELATFHVGTLDAFVGFFVMWGVMMWAMMHPAMTRFTRDYTAAHQGSGVQAALAVTAFFASYHIIWMLSAVFPLGFHAGLSALGYEGIYGFVQSHTTLAIGGVFTLAGAYQLTSVKQNLLRDCCANVKPHEDDIPAAFREGIWHGTRCVAICFGFFFLIMPFIGEMNFTWMIGLTTLVTIERLPIWGDDIAVATGIISLLAGVIVLVVQPDLVTPDLLSFSMSMGGM
jgi:predicted metal-binding membrane protein